MEFFDKGKSQGYIELDIWGEQVRPKEISQILQVKPTYMNEKGDISEYGDKPYLVASWEFNTNETSIEDFSIPMDELINVFKDKTGHIREIKRKYDCIVKVCVVLYNHQPFLPSLGFRDDQIAFLAEIGAQLDYDIYLSGSEDDD